MRRTTSLAMLAVMAIAASGCGSSGDDTLSKSDLVAKANAICKTTNAKIAKISTPSGVTGLVTALDKQIGIITPAVQQIDALKPPSSMQSTYDQWVGSLKKMLALTNQGKTAAQQGDTKKIVAIGKQFGELNTASDAQAAKLGLTVCSAGASPKQ